MSDTTDEPTDELQAYVWQVIDDVNAGGSPLLDPDKLTQLYAQYGFTRMSGSQVAKLYGFTPSRSSDSDKEKGGAK